MILLTPLLEVCQHQNPKKQKQGAAYLCNIDSFFYFNAFLLCVGMVLLDTPQI